MPPESEIRSKGDQARADILAAARRLFITQGYAGTSMRAIARQAGGRAVAGLYNHFPTKEAIFAALIEETNPYEELFGALEGTLDQVSTGPEFVRTALRTVLTIMPRHLDFFQLVQIDGREFDSRNLHHVLTEQAMPRVLALIDRLQEFPGLKPMNGLVWLRLIASLVIGFVITEQIAGVPLFANLTYDEWGEFYANTLLYGIAESGPDYAQPDPES
jgi:AcrR family transcriptional regulator